MTFLMAKRKKKSLPIEEPAPQDSRPKVQLASMRVRLAAVIYDSLLIIALNAIVGGLLIGFATPAEVSEQHRASALSPEFRHFILFPTMVFTTWVFYGYFWQKTGQTLGMQTWRIRVIRPDGRFPGWIDSFGRCAAAMILPALCGLAAQALYSRDSAFIFGLLTGFLANYAWTLINRRGLAWHDQLSATLVIRVPKPDQEKRGFFGWFSEKE